MRITLSFSTHGYYQEGRVVGSGFHRQKDSSTLTKQTVCTNLVCKENIENNVSLLNKNSAPKDFKRTLKLELEELIFLSVV